MYKKRTEFDRKILYLLYASIILTICAELSFTNYVGVYGFFSILGHYFKLLAFYVLYKAFISIGLKDPYALIYRSLSESEERFRLFFEKANDPIFIVNKDDDIIDANEAASKVFGYTKIEFVSMKLSDLQAPEVRGLPGTVAKSEQEKYGEHPFEALDIDKGGRVFPVEVVISKIRLKGKNYTFHVSRDISSRKKMESEIELLYHAIEQSPAIVVITDSKGLIEFVNPKFTEITGYTLLEIKGKNPRILKTGLLPEGQL